MITVHKDSKPRMVKGKSQKNEYKNPREFQNGKILVLICQKIYQDWECKIVCVKSNCADLFYAPY